MAKKQKIPPLGDRISFLTHRVEQKTELICNPLFRHLHVALQDSRVLVNLLEAGKLRIGDLVYLMVMPQSTVSHQILSLEKRKLVRRSKGTQDSRSVIVELTTHGREVARECNRMSEEVYQVMVEGLSKADLDHLRVMLRGIYERLEAFHVRRVAGLAEKVQMAPRRPPRTKIQA